MLAMWGERALFILQQSHRLFLFKATIIEAGTMGGHFVNLHLYPLLAASLEIYSKYVKHEKALGEYEKKKKKKQRESGPWTQRR